MGGLAKATIVDAGATVRAQPSHRTSSCRYTGRRIDPASREAWPRWGRVSPEKGLYYYRARYYAPRIGRFLQTDPVGYDAGLHLYAYVGNDPVNAMDPSGEAACGAKPDPACGTVVMVRENSSQDTSRLTTASDAANLTSKAVDVESTQIEIGAAQAKAEGIPLGKLGNATVSVAKKTSVTVAAVASGLEIASEVDSGVPVDEAFAGEAAAVATTAAGTALGSAVGGFVGSLFPGPGTAAGAIGGGFVGGLITEASGASEMARTVTKQAIQRSKTKRNSRIRFVRIPPMDK